jgi:5-methylcytosine-specific restriction endonuclease McrA
VSGPARVPRGRHEHRADRAGARAATDREVGPVAPAAAAELEPADHALRGVLARGGGRPLEHGIRASMERVFGADFGAVRLHVDSHAGALADARRATAFTAGHDVFVQPRAYAPGSHVGRALLGHELAHVVQQQGAGVGVQYSRPEDYGSWDEATDANKYSEALLGRQRTHPLRRHIGLPFTEQERQNVLRINRTDNGGVLRSDDPPHHRLYVRDTSLIPHVDHRYPRVSGGTNSYANAMVLSGHANMVKNATPTLKREPDKPLKQYEELWRDEGPVTRFAKFSAEQREAILDANRDYWGVGAIVDDADGETVLEDPDPERVPQVDHITPQSDGGSTYYFNAAVIGGSANSRKGGKRKRLTGSWDSDASDSDPDELYGAEELDMTLSEFIDYRYDQAQARKARPAKKAKKKSPSPSPAESESDSEGGE